MRGEYLSPCLLGKIVGSNPDSQSEPSLFLMKDFFRVIDTKNGDSVMFQFKFDFLM